MSNIITMNKGTDDYRSIVMSNQGTDCFLDLSIMSAENFSQTASQKKLIDFLRERRVLNEIAPGTAGFDVEDMPWKASSMRMDRLFLIYVANNAMTETVVRTMSYEVNRDVVFPWLEQFIEMIDSDTYTFPIKKITGFRKTKEGQLVPAYKKGRYLSEKIRYNDVITNLVCYDGYHLILRTETKPFTELEAYTYGMGLAYINDDGQFVTPFSINRISDKTFVGICIEDWEEFKEDIPLPDSKYLQFLDLLKPGDDPFYSNENMDRLRRTVEGIESGTVQLTEHELMD